MGDLQKNSCEGLGRPLQQTGYCRLIESVQDIQFASKFREVLFQDEE